MSITGIASNILSSLSGSQNPQTRSQQVQSEFAQLGQDLQSGNLTQAQSDFTTLSQNLPGLTQNSNAGANNSISQTFAQLGQDLQSGNLGAAQQDFTTIQQDAQQVASQVGGHHHNHRSANTQNSSASSSSSQQTNAIDQAFSQLAQTLQTGNLQGAQSAFSALQSDLQQIGGFYTSGSSTASTAPSTGSLNVTA